MRESVFRQVGTGGNPIYFDPARQPPIHRSLFYPARNDSDGLSLIRSSFRTAVWAAYRVEQPDTRFRLAEILVATLVDAGSHVGIQGLVLDCTPDKLDIEHGEPWAHCVVRQINRTDYDNNSEAKKRIKEWALQIENKINASEVKGPFPKPGATDPYRPAAFDGELANDSQSGCLLLFRSPRLCGRLILRRWRSLCRRLFGI